MTKCALCRNDAVIRIIGILNRDTKNAYCAHHRNVVFPVLRSLKMEAYFTEENICQ